MKWLNCVCTLKDGDDLVAASLSGDLEMVLSSVYASLDQPDISVGALDCLNRGKLYFMDFQFCRDRVVDFSLFGPSEVIYSIGVDELRSWSKAKFFKALCGVFGEYFDSSPSFDFKSYFPTFSKELIGGFYE